MGRIGSYLSKKKLGGISYMKRYIREAYDKCDYILDNGKEYEFHNSFDSNSIKIVKALDIESRNEALKQKVRHMDAEDHMELWTLIDRDEKAFYRIILNK